MDKTSIQETVRQGIPLADFANFQIETLTDNRIDVTGEQQANINVHGTAFAGSQYVIGTLAAWSLIFSRLPENVALVQADGAIKYLAPVIGNIHASAEIEEDQMQSFLQRLHKKGRSIIRVEVVISYNGKPTSIYNATMHAGFNA